MMAQSNPQVLAKKHLVWLQGMGDFVAVPTVKASWKRDRDKYLYRKFHPGMILREMLPGEIVIEFDGYEGQRREEALSLAAKTCQALDRDGVKYLMFDHEGKSPHIELWVRGLEGLAPVARKQYKEAFIRKYVPDIAKADLSLTAESHLIATEYLRHWKYGTVKMEVRNMLSKYKIDGLLHIDCARCGLRRCEYVDERGVFYCTLCLEGTGC